MLALVPNWFKRQESILVLATLVLWTPLVGWHMLNGEAALSGNPSPLVDQSLRPTDVSVQWPKKAVEGKTCEVVVHFQASEKFLKKPMILEYLDGNYRDLHWKKIAHQVQWNGSPQTLKVHFQTPGRHPIVLKNAEQLVLSKSRIDVTPFPATVFPKDWQSHQTLSSNPADWHIWVNLYAESDKPKGQRQYAQITFQNQIIDRFLVSSGAPGHPTPMGQFKLGFKEYYPRSARYGNTPMPFWSAIDTGSNLGDVGFHSLEGEGYMYLLGHPASHGCLRLSRLPSVETNPKTGQKYWGDRGGARWIFDRVPPATPVTIFAQKRPDFQSESFEHYLKQLYQQAKKPHGKTI